MNSITFQLPSNDIQLADQVYSHIVENSEVLDARETLTNMAKKYRFAGYIGFIQYLFVEVERLKEELAKTREELEKAKSKKKGWFY
jgi:hypothetical protein